MTSTGTRETIFETARAKINLTLEVLGRRSDGYHEIDSLVAFADCPADDIVLEPGPEATVDVAGPFASAIAGANLVATTLDLIAEAAPGLRLGRVTLTKRLPIAAGIGGGSADAAATLRAIRRANSELAAGVDWQGLAARLGADVPVCFGNLSTWMSGKGEALTPLRTPLPRLDVVLANPLVPVPVDKTAQVFRRLGAKPYATRGTEASGMARPAIPTRDELVRLIKRSSNDLEAAAEVVVPALQTVLDELERLPMAEVVRVSGGGPTAFAVFPDAGAAESAAGALKSRWPDWWIAAAVLS